MADIKKIEVGIITYNIKDEVARNTKQDKITAVVNPSVADDGGSPSATATFEEGELAFAFKNLKLRFSDLTDADKEAIRGPQGVTSVYDSSTQNFLTTLETTTGQSQTTVMTQKAVTDISEVVIKNVSLSGIFYNAGRINGSNWNEKNTATNPSDGFYMNVVAYREKRIVITPQDGKRIRVAFTKNIFVNPEMSATGDYALVSDTSASNGGAVIYATGYSEPIYPSSDTPIDTIIPADCNYLWCSYLYSTALDIRPKSIEILESKNLKKINAAAHDAAKYQAVLMEGMRASKYGLVLGTNKFGTSASYSHSVIPVKEGERYIVESYNNSTWARYCFATSNSFSSGGNIPLVDGTAVMAVPENSSVEIVIPSGCSYLLTNYDGYNLRLYKCLVSEEESIIKGLLTKTHYSHYPDYGQYVDARPTINGEDNENFGQLKSSPAVSSDPSKLSSSQYIPCDGAKYIEYERLTCMKTNKEHNSGDIFYDSEKNPMTEGLFAIPNNNDLTGMQYTIVKIPVPSTAAYFKITRFGNSSIPVKVYYADVAMFGSMNEGITMIDGKGIAYDMQDGIFILKDSYSSSHGDISTSSSVARSWFIENKGYSKLEATNLYSWLSTANSISFYDSINASHLTYISGVEQSPTGYSSQSVDIPDKCKLIVVTSTIAASNKLSINLWLTNENLAKNTLTSRSTDDVNYTKLLDKSRSIDTMPVTLMHCSDIHGNILAMNQIMDFYSEYKSYIDDIINTGDLVLSTYDDAGSTMPTYYNKGFDRALFANGNHDTTLSTASGAVWNAAGAENCYNAYFAHIDEWGVTQPEGAEENHLMYYYKDYATSKVRLIVLDVMFDDAGQRTWFNNLLTSMLDSNNAAYGYAVVVAAHFIPGSFVKDNIVKKADGDKTSFHAYGSEQLYEIDSRFRCNSYYPNAIQTFIDAGGKFAIWLCGHHHSDRFAYPWKEWTRPINGEDETGAYYMANNEKHYAGKSDILFSAINTASPGKVSQGRNLISQKTVVNAVTISSSIVRIIRFGYNCDLYLRPINVLVYDYVNKKVIANY